MTLLELIESLEHLADELGEEKAAETEVWLAVQPRWAFEHSIAGLAVSTDLPNGENECADCGAPRGRPHEPDCEKGTGERDAPPGIWDAAR